MNKKILTLCAIASIAAAVFSCSKKDGDDNTTTTTSTTATTATTSTTSSTSTTTPGKVYPTPGSDQVAIDTVLYDYTVETCMNIAQGRYELKAVMDGTGNSTNKLTTTWGKVPNFTNDFTISTSIPPINNGTLVQVVTKLDNIDYTAQSGKVKFFKNTDSSGIQFTKVTFKGTNDSTVIMSGFLQCP